MDDNVIPFPKNKVIIFPSKKTKAKKEVTGKGKDVMANKPKTKWGMQQACKELLESEDYEEILCGIMDPDYYVKLEHDLKQIVDAYFELP